MAAGVMHHLLGGAYAADASSSVTISSMTLVSTVGEGTRTGAANVYIEAVGGSLYWNEGAAASATNNLGVIVEGAPRLMPATADYRVIAKDTGAKVAATWWK